jgi:hypothetical protein
VTFMRSRLSFSWPHSWQRSTRICVSEWLIRRRWVWSSRRLL